MELCKPVNDGLISSPYGSRILNGVSQFHTGIDIVYKNASFFVPVFAAKSGKLIVINDIEALGGGFGICLYIMGDDGYFSIYAHLKNRNCELKENMTIIAGSFLGVMGSSGNSTGLHLHYEERLTLTAGNFRQPKDVINLYNAQT